MHRHVLTILVLALVVGCVSPAADPGGASPPDAVGHVVYQGATITTPQGAITVVFYPDVAPETVAQFQQLARAGFYNGSVFHRTVDNFVIQGGAPPEGREEADTIPLEAGGFFAAGTLGIARNEAPDSGTSQFFIDEYPQPHLHEPDPLQSPTGYTYGPFTAFGQVVEGMDVVRAINDLPHDDSGMDRPLDPPPMNVTLHPVTVPAELADQLPLRTWGRQLAPPYRVSLESPRVLEVDQATWLRVYVEDQVDRGAQTGVSPTVQVLDDGGDMVDHELTRHEADGNIHTLALTFPAAGTYRVLVNDGARPLALFEVTVG